jgi:hypothetical protein
MVPAKDGNVNLLNASVGKRLLPICAALSCTFAALRASSAQEWVGTEVSATVPAVVLGSSASRFAGAHGFGLESFVRGAPFAVCDPSRGNYCDGMHVSGVEMNTFPRFRLDIDLPASFSIQGHLWTMTHEQVDLELRQAIMGTTLRYAMGQSWYELGAGVAERAENQNLEHDPRGIDCQPGAPQPAVLAGVGAWFAASEHVYFDLRLRGGVSVGDEGADVYHANLVAQLIWD